MCSYASLLLIYQKMNYQVKDTMSVVDAKDKTFKEFFLKVKMSLMVHTMDVHAIQLTTT